MIQEAKIKKFAVIGNPIKHSLSPVIHQYFARENNITIDYQIIEAEIGAFKSKVEEFFNVGGHGLNVSIPFKEEACKLVDELGAEVKFSGSLNTITIGENRKLYGNNTDGLGFINDIKQRLHWDFSEKKILLVGAGGAVRGILPEILTANPQKIVLVNRKLDRAKAIQSYFANNNIIVKDFFELKTENFDYIINATSASLQKILLPIPINVYKDVLGYYDLAYGKHLNVILEKVSSFGVKTVSDGLGMLVSQAAFAFKLWHGIFPNILPVLNKLKQEYPY